MIRTELSDSRDVIGWTTLRQVPVVEVDWSWLSKASDILTTSKALLAVALAVDTYLPWHSFVLYWALAPLLALLLLVLTMLAHLLSSLVVCFLIYLLSGPLGRM